MQKGKSATVVCFALGVGRKHLSSKSCLFAKHCSYLECYKTMFVCDTAVVERSGLMTKVSFLVIENIVRSIPTI
jgi:hypothetical protein